LKSPEPFLKFPDGQLKVAERSLISSINPLKSHSCIGIVFECFRVAMT
jgi:hypothetical protein